MFQIRFRSTLKWYIDPKEHNQVYLEYKMFFSLLDICIDCLMDMTTGKHKSTDRDYFPRSERWPTRAHDAERIHGGGEMEPILVPAIMLSLVFVAIQASVVIFLTKRAIELGLGNLWFLIVSCAIFIVSALLGATGSPLHILVQPFASLCIITFTKRAFYEQARSNYALIMSVAILFAGLTFIVRVYRLYAGDSGLLYLMNQLVLFFVFTPGYAWLAKACFDAKRRLSKDHGIAPWIQKRYMLLGTSAMFTAFMITPSFFMESSSSFNTMAGFFVLLLIVMDCLVFSILNYLCWVMPLWFKRRLGMSAVEALVEMPRPSEQHEILTGNDETLTNRAMMAIIDYLGNKLAVRINKSPGALKGLLLVIFQSEREGSGEKPLRLSDLKHAITVGLRSRLEQLGIKDAIAITKQFSDEVTQNQSVLIMMSV